MAINASKNSNSNFEPIAAGLYVARCYYMCEIGTIPVVWKGQPKMQKKVHIKWELPGELKEFKPGDGEKPYSVSNEYTLSMGSSSHLRKMLESWRGKVFTEEEAESFDITKLLGKECMLSIIHNKSGDKTYANISGVSVLPKGTVCPPQINPTFEFSLGEFDQAKFDSLPDFLKDKIKTSDEYKSIMNPEHTDATPSGGSDEPPPTTDDLPFKISPTYFKFTL